MNTVPLNSSIHKKMRYTLEESFLKFPQVETEEEEEEVETEEEEEEEEQVEADEEEEDASVLQVTIPGDGDCFYLAIVEAFLREGVDVVSLFAGRMGCEVQKSFCQQ